MHALYILNWSRSWFFTDDNRQTLSFSIIPLTFNCCFLIILNFLIIFAYAFMPSDWLTNYVLTDVCHQSIYGFLMLRYEQ